MYKIIGANQVEYGPVTADQLRQWIAEGRVHAQTAAQAVGETTWKPISSFPEFTASFPGSAAAPSPMPTSPPPLAAAAAPITPETGRARALEEISGPAIGLMVTSGLGILLSVLGILGNLLGIAFGNFNQFNALHLHTQDQQVFKLMQMSNGVMGVIIEVIKIAAGVFILFAAVKMKKLENHGMCVAASVIALIPCFSPCCCIGLPIGIWALVVLNKPEVKGCFS